MQSEFPVAISTSMEEESSVFDRTLLRRRRERAAAELHRTDFLVREVADRLADRLDDVKRSFPHCLDLGCHTGQLRRILNGRGGIERLVQSDLSHSMSGLAAGPDAPGVVCDEEFLPFRDASFDLVTSVLTLHWVNDLPGTLLQINRALKPDGLFLAAMLGGESLFELRESLLQAEMDEQGGVSPRVSPFADLRDLGGLLQRAGFALPVVDVDRLSVGYAEPLALLQDLRGMGATNAVHMRSRNFMRRRTLFRALEHYSGTFGREDGRVTATFEVIYLTAWAPAADQPRALRPGSATHRLADALGTTEVPAGDTAKPGRRNEKTP